MPHVTEEIWSQFHDTRLIVSPWPEPARRRARRGALDEVQSAAATFRRSGVLVPLEGEEKRIFDAVVKPERVKANGDVEAERERLRKEIARAEGDARERALRVNAPAELVEAEREKLARFRRDLEALGGLAASLKRTALARPVTAAPRGGRKCRAGSKRSRRGPRSSGSGACGRCSPRSASRSGRSPRSTSSARTARRRPRYVRGAAARRGAARRRVHLAARARLGGADPGRRRARRPRAGARARAPACGRRDAVRGAHGRGARRVRRERGGRRGRRGGARRSLRRDERARRAAWSC